ncbi:MAG TPA: M23 family metallopeptidase [Blastocatellia bacterium]|nr:M23 family metallopeptidase [Blastocatellia bacterium]
MINLQPPSATFTGENATTGSRRAKGEPQPSAPASQPAGMQPLIQPPTTTTTEPVAAPAEPVAPVAGPTDPSISVGEGDFGYLRTRSLLIPVAGVTIGQLRDSFLDSRSEGRTHQALDIMASLDTPVLATDDGKVMKLNQSDRGGIMIYQSDPSGNYVYYYGHLSRYADGLSDGKHVKRGEVIGYVGDTGNAGAGNYHLHFGISKMRAPGKWSGGDPINPYPLLARKQ